MNFKNISFLISVILLFSCNNKNTDETTDPVEPLVFEYQLVWADEFDGSDVDVNNWSFEIWNAGFVNNEWQKYVNNTDNYKVENGKLAITATKIGANEFGGYSSTRLSSKNKKEFKYGRIEFRAKMPAGTGTWPALWMLGVNQDQVGWPKCGEIDVLEYVGYQPNKTHTNVHTESDFGSTAAYKAHSLTTAEEEYHIYGITWTNDKIEFYIDDTTNIVNTYSPSNRSAINWPFSQKFYFIMNFAVGGSWGGIQGVDGAIWPQTLFVDYIRVYQLKPI